MQIQHQHNNLMLFFKTIRYDLKMKTPKDLTKIKVYSTKTYIQIKLGANAQTTSLNWPYTYTGVIKSICVVWVRSTGNNPTHLRTGFHINYVYPINVQVTWQQSIMVCLEKPIIIEDEGSKIKYWIFVCSIKNYWWMR